MPDLTAIEQAACEEALKRIGDCIRRRSTTLDLSRLRLHTLPPRITQLAGLAVLNLSNNQLHVLPPELSQFKHLAGLDLSHNPLDTLSPEIGNLTGLTRLDLSHTGLALLPEEIGNLTGLTRLSLDHNKLAALPREIGRLRDLTRLYLSHNRLESLPPELGELAKLTRLFVSENRLTALPPEVGILSRLTVLDLSHNPLGSLPPELAQLARLTVLELCETLLATLPPEIGRLANLTELDLRRNSLADLPQSLMEMERLERLFLHDNPGLQLSPSILGPDPQKSQDCRFALPKSILDFYFGRKSGKTRPLNEVKLVLLGNVGAGKTNIAHALRDLPFREGEASTPAIAWSACALEGTGCQTVTAHVWDCSGQPATRVLHPFFFSSRNLFVVVLAGNVRHDDEGAEYWLDLIRKSAMDVQGQVPPVIVALNQWNVAGRRAEVDRIALRERFPFIRGFVEMDCKVKKGVPTLKAALCRELERMPWVREPFPSEWDAVRRDLVSRTTCLTDHGFRELCVERGVEEAGQQDYLAEIFHHLGVALTHRHDSRLPEQTALQPEWLASNLYPLLHRAERQSGILRQSDAEAVLLTESAKNSLRFLMQVLVRFGIAIEGQSASGGIWLLPHLQPEQAPAHVASFGTSAEVLQLRFSYQTLPEQLVARIIARRFDFVEGSWEQKQQWRHGVILARKGARALVRMDLQLRQLTITVTGPVSPRQQFADLFQAEIRSLHAESPEVGWVEETRMPAK